MTEIPRYYLILFNAVTKALEALERKEVGRAEELLKEGQQEAEEAYISEGEE